MFMETFNAETSTYTLAINGAPVQILHPLLILNSKCRSVLTRATFNKKVSDADDILFLLGWLANAGILPQPQQVPHASKEFVEFYIATYGNPEAWTRAGYDMQRGMYFVLLQGGVPS